MRRTVQIARANAAAAIDVPAARDDHAHVFRDDTELGAWLAAQLDDAEEYLAATLERAERVCTVLNTGIDARLQRYQQQLALLQASILGAVVMALTVVQTLQYHLPIPGPIQAPTIATGAAVALVLPGAILRWIRASATTHPCAASTSRHSPHPARQPAG